MSSNIVAEAISLGFNRRLVRRVVKDQIDEYMCNYQTLDALLDKLVITEDNLIDLDSGSSEEDNNGPTGLLLYYFFYKICILLCILADLISVLQCRTTQYSFNQAQYSSVLFR